MISPFICSNVITWQVHNALLLSRLSLKHLLENLSEMEAILQLDGAKTVHQITSLETASPLVVTESYSSSSANQQNSQLKSNHAKNSQAESNSVSDVTDQDSSDKGVSISHPDLDLLASQTAGVANRPAGTPVGDGGGMGTSGERGERSMNPEEIVSMDELLSKQLVDGLVSLLAQVPLL